MMGEMPRVMGTRTSAKVEEQTVDVSSLNFALEEEAAEFPLREVLRNLPQVKSVEVLLLSLWR